MPTLPGRFSAAFLARDISRKATYHFSSHICFKRVITLEDGFLPGMPGI